VADAASVGTFGRISTVKVMQSNSTPLPRPSHSLPIVLTLSILASAISLFICAGAAYQVIYPHHTRVVWYYDEFQMVGAPSGPDSLRAEGALPRNVAVAAISHRFREHQVPQVVVELGRRIELSTITWESAVAAWPEDEPLKLPDGKEMVEMLERTGGSSQLTVKFEREKLKSVSAHAHVRIYNTANGQSLELLDSKWSDVERVFGKPTKKERLRLPTPWH
jgi:hypothetical protein